MKTAKKINLAIIFLLSIIALIGCSDDDSSPKAERKVVFKAEASSGSSLNQAVFGYDTDLTTQTSLSGTTWSSDEITVPADASVASIIVNAVGANGTSTLKVQIFVDGQLKKEGQSTGAALVAQAQYSFE